MENCLFDKIIAKEIPAAIIYEDNATIAFLDIRPTNKGHALIVPKQHSRNILDIETQDLHHLMTVAQKIAHAMRDTLSADGITTTMNTEPAGGQEIFHTHIHVIPRFEGDNIFQAPTHTEYEGDEKEDFREKLSNALS